MSSGKKILHANEVDTQLLGEKFPLLTVCGQGLLSIPIVLFYFSLAIHC